MGANSNIEWTRHTFNHVRGCTKISDGCKFCYADTMSKRNPGVLGTWGPTGTRIVASEAYWREPAKWNHAAKEAGEVHTVFCASLADVGEGPDTMPAESWPIVQAARARLVDTFMPLDNLRLLLLTKRPENMPELFPAEFLARCGVGTSTEDQAAADKRIARLLKCPAMFRFLSVEPLLSEINFRWASWDDHAPHPRRIGNLPPVDRDGYMLAGSVNDLDGLRMLDWVIAGGESGPHARPMSPRWVRLIRDQCVAAGVPFFFKQWGEWEPQGQSVGGTGFGRAIYTWEEGDGGDCRVSFRVGKKAAGRTLDGRTWDEFPEVA